MYGGAASESFLLQEVASGVNLHAILPTSFYDQTSCEARAKKMKFALKFEPKNLLLKRVSFDAQETETCVTVMNPLLQASWPNGIAPFSEISPEHFAPAYAQAFAEHNAELDRIANAPASFDNTIVAYDAAGALLKRIDNVFSNLTGSATNEALQQVETELSPKIAAHRTSVYLNAALFAKIDSLYQKRDALGLSGVQKRMVERVHLDFALAGANLKGDARANFAANAEKLATLQTEFSQRLLKDENDFVLPVASDAELAGLPQWLKDSAAETAASRKVAEPYAFNSSRSVVEAVLAFAENRALRQKLLAAFRARGNWREATRTLALINDTMTLRQAQSELMGYRCFADYALADTMAQRPGNVRELLGKLWPAAKRRAAVEYAEIVARAAQDGVRDVQIHDWRYYAEKIRQEKYAVNDDEVKPYFSLDAMTRAMFECAGKLFGIRFEKRDGVSLYHPDCTLYDVTRAADGARVGHFITDNFARAGKQSGAWMSYLREQSTHFGGLTPIVLNNNNFPKPATGKPALLGFDDVRTLFHEFGHGLHGLLSNSPFERLGGTNVLQDFVELPSQLFEHWAVAPQVLKAHAKHVETGEIIPDALIAKLKKASVVNQGLDAVEAIASVLVDLTLHEQTDFSALDPLGFEAKVLADIGMPSHMKPRHEMPHFQHIFAGNWYASRYYVYLWAEVLDADAFDAFNETGDVFHAPLAKKLYDHIYSAGNTVEPQTTYRAFRGRDAKVEPMLKERGLLEAA
jgi:peptidyl-dipeptidase Dcp